MVDQRVVEADRAKQISGDRRLRIGKIARTIKRLRPHDTGIVDYNVERRIGGQQPLREIGDAAGAFHIERNGLHVRPTGDGAIERILPAPGNSLGAAFCGVWIWAEENLTKVEAARTAFDTR